MKKSYIVLIFVICLLIVLSNLVFFYIHKNLVSNIPECSNLEPNEKDDCYNSLSLCNKINDENLKTNCYINSATNLNDSTKCDKIQDSNPNMKELCYATVGSTRYNLAACEKVQESDLKNQCFAAAKNDTSYCSNIKNQDIKEYPCI